MEEKGEMKEKIFINMEYFKVTLFFCSENFTEIAYYYYKICGTQPIYLKKLEFSKIFLKFFAC